jgi:hypothetical protein
LSSRHNKGYGRKTRTPKGFSTRKTNKHLKSEANGSRQQDKHFKRRMPEDANGDSERELRVSEPNGPQINYLDSDFIKTIHEQVIDRNRNINPESTHILNKSALENALDAPKTNLYGKEVYPSIFEKTAA